MPKNTVSDPITDQEMAFAHLILFCANGLLKVKLQIRVRSHSSSYGK
jgi:hypothetical protein